MSKIQAFQSTFKKGVARPNLFHVVMNPPVHLDGPPSILGTERVNYRGTAFNGAASDEMELRVQSITMPGKNTVSYTHLTLPTKRIV